MVIVALSEAVPAPGQICGLCGRSFEYGPLFFEGIFLESYDLWICAQCRSSCGEGITPELERAFEAHLRNSGRAPPARKPDGRYPLAELTRGRPDN